VSDWEALDRLSEPKGSNYRECIAKSVNAGMDMVQFINWSHKIYSAATSSFTFAESSTDYDPFQIREVLGRSCDLGGDRGDTSVTD
jgi:hypothetical protein